MHPEIERRLAMQRAEDLREAGAATRGGGEVVLRSARRGDRAELAGLAALDDALPPVGPALVAEVDGSIRAVLPLDGGRPFADPFRRTSDLIALLEERARQLAGARASFADRHHRLAWLSHGHLRRAA